MEKILPYYRGSSYDVFVSKMNNGLTDLTASTFFGGSYWDFGYALAVDQDDNVYFTGHTASPNYTVTPGAADPTYNGVFNQGVTDDAYLTRLSGNLDSVLSSTFMGGDLWEIGLSLKIDDSGNIFTTGYTNSANFPVTQSAHDTSFNYGPYNAFIMKLNPELTEFSASTFLGGSDEDCGYCLIIDEDGNVIIARKTASVLDFPLTAGSYSNTYAGGAYNIFISILDSLLSGEELNI